MTLIAISGGIGSGKSIVSRALAVMGYDVYDCDSHAREIMDCDRALATTHSNGYMFGCSGKRTYRPQAAGRKGV